tara:strand:+ start:14494 stop:15000 length:507 start_codon:yes stop_codon:yes gene_type:complete
MEYSKLISKTNDILAWLEVNDAGALEGAIRGIITVAQVEGQTEKQYGNYWGSIRQMCGNLPNSPIRKGTQPSIPAEALACVDSVVTQVQTAFAGITESNELILEVVLPFRNTTGKGFESMDELAAYMAGRARDALVKAHKDGRWDGTLNDGLTGMTPPQPASKKEDSE